MTAPTHKAVKVLKKNPIPGVDYRTIHSALSLTETVNEATGEVSYTAPKKLMEPPPIESASVLIVDEVSMLSSEIFKLLVPYIKKGLKVLFTGDPAQIPPVKEKDCIPFMHSKDWNMMECELTKVMRQKDGNPILEFATAIRSDYKTGSFEPKEHMLDNGEGIKLVKFNSAEEKALLHQLFTDERFKQDSDFMKVIAWRNTTVDKYNDMIRRMIYASHLQHEEDVLPEIMPNEKLIMDKPFSINNRAVLSTNDEVEVVSLREDRAVFTYYDVMNQQETVSIKLYQATVKFFYKDRERVEIIPIVHENSKADFHGMLEALKKIAINSAHERRGNAWRQYFKIKERVAYVKYNYAITGHKSQGSSYDYAMVLKWDIDYNRNIEERNRILYVACTRAKNTLFIET